MKERRNNTVLSKESIELEIDPSILEKNMKIVQVSARNHGVHNLTEIQPPNDVVQTIPTFRKTQ